MDACPDASTAMPRDDCRPTPPPQTRHTNRDNPEGSDRRKFMGTLHPLPPDHTMRSPVGGAAQSPEHTGARATPRPHSDTCLRDEPATVGRPQDEDSTHPQRPTPLANIAPTPIKRVAPNFDDAATLPSTKTPNLARKDGPAPKAANRRAVTARAGTAPVTPTMLNPDGRRLTNSARRPSNEPVTSAPRALHESAANASSAPTRLRMTANTSHIRLRHLWPICASRS